MDIKVATFLVIINDMNTKCVSRIVPMKTPEWLHNPCDAKTEILEYDGVNEGFAEMELKMFNRYIEGKYHTISAGNNFEVPVGDSCPNVTKSLSHLKNDSKVRVFNNMILRWAAFLHETMVTITDDPIRQDIYKDILSHIKRLACEFHAILCHPRKKRPFSGFDPCFRTRWSHTESHLFDLQLLKKLYFFFSESLIILDGKLNHSCDDEIHISY